MILFIIATFLFVGLIILSICKFCRKKENNNQALLKIGTINFEMEYKDGNNK